MFNLIKPLFDIFDKVIPDSKQAEEVKFKILQLEQTGQLESEKTCMSAILAEAQSVDKWTSRARPAFLYVVYIMILFSLPMGILYAVTPILAHNISIGVQEWLVAIPKPMWDLFGIGYLGYVVGRSWDKTQSAKKQ